MLRSIFGIIAAASLLAACGGGGSGSSESRFKSACNTQTNMPPEMCDCMAKKAKSELSDDAFKMLIASLEEDQATADRLRGQLSMEEAMQAGMFMVSGTQACVAEQN